MRGLRYADNSQSASQQTGSSGWLRRKTGRVCRTRNFAASQSKNRLPHLGKFAGAFRKVVITLTANDNAVVLIERMGPGPVQF